MVHEIKYLMCWVERHRARELIEINSVDLLLLSERPLPIWMAEACWTNANILNPMMQVLFVDACLSPSTGVTDRSRICFISCNVIFCFCVCAVVAVGAVASCDAGWCCRRC